MSSLKRAKHAVYDLKYHLVWTPKYRKKIFDDAEIREFVKEIFQEIADQRELEIDTMEVMEDHVHIFLEAPPRVSPSQIVQMLKSISARETFKKFPALRKRLWNHEIWEDGYFVRSVGDKVTTEIIQRYIKYQHQEEQLKLEL
jgi:putative transposase